MEALAVVFRCVFRVGGGEEGWNEVVRGPRSRCAASVIWGGPTFGESEATGLELLEDLGVVGKKGCPGVVADK